MSVQALSWVFDYSPTTGSDRLVLLAIANHADVDGAHSFPGIDTLAREARVSRATAKRAIRGLEDHQHIDVVHGVGRGHPNLYRVITDSGRVGTRRPLPAHNA
ncbi:MAG: helix-turn-helix domain-containing protein, partial [Actinomycetota bacterium]|nr:helix-turn-helix domain-containing protein [Actinomycetota bacterium]